MRRQQIIAIVVVVLLAGGAGAGYQFYFRPALDKFAEDQQYLAALNTKLNSLKKTFPEGKPEAAVARVREKIQPWHETLDQRAKQFTLRDFMKTDPLPKTDVLKAYYDETAQKIATDLYTELAVKGVYYRPNIDFYFGVARPGSLAGRKVNELQVLNWLSTLKLGTSVTRMLVDSEILGIDDINLWSPHITPDGFSSYAVGVSMWMTLDQFCKFIDKIQGDDTMCITIQGFRVTNSALRSYADPPLKIDLVFQIDEYRYVSAPVQTASAKLAGPAFRKPGADALGAPGDQLMNDVKNRRAAGGTATSPSQLPWWRRMLPW
jgi:hypothetical protein